MLVFAVPGLLTLLMFNFPKYLGSVSVCSQVNRKLNIQDIDCGRGAILMCNPNPNPNPFATVSLLERASYEQSILYMAYKPLNYC